MTEEHIPRRKNKTPEELSDVQIGNIPDRVQGNDHNNQTIWEKTG